LTAVYLAAITLLTALAGGAIVVAVRVTALRNSKWRVMMATAVLHSVAVGVVIALVTDGAVGVTVAASVLISWVVTIVWLRSARLGPNTS
jgi:hypothetical protein